MATRRRPRFREEFDVAVICALEVESDAVEGVFDGFWKNHGGEFAKAKNDTNIYQTGWIGEHNVVLVYMPGMGKAHAASVSSSMLSSFPSIRLALVVGVCGGIPGRTQEELILGDVVVSTEVVQFDHGSRYADAFARKDISRDERLGQPNKEISAFLRLIRGRSNVKAFRNQAIYFVNELCKKEDFRDHAYPGIDYDRLYVNGYRHKHRSTDCEVCMACEKRDDPVCEISRKSRCAELGCADSQLVPRKRLVESSTSRFEIRGEHGAKRRHLDRTVVTPSPFIHFGAVASGDWVVKSDVHRDQIKDVIAYEMEGSGVWHNVPTLVIKSVCDYADSHKCKDWQKYASATAAASTKAFLYAWPKSDRFVNRIESVDSCMTDDVSQAISQDGQRSKTVEILGWISKMPYSQHHASVQNGRLEEVGSWLLASTEYKQWVGSETSSLMWLHGTAGSGKSKIVSSVIDSLIRTETNPSAMPFAYVYCMQDPTEPDRGDPDAIIRSLLRQLACPKPNLLISEPVLKKVEEIQGEGFKARQLSLSDCKDLILDLLTVKPIIIIIDALDECASDRRYQLLDFWEDLLRDSKLPVKIFVSSRDYENISSRLNLLSNHIVDSSQNSDDVEKYVQIEVDRSIRRGRLLGGKVTKELRNTLVSSLVNGSQGVLLWASLQIQNICNPQRMKVEEDVLEELKKLPRQLADVYTSMYGEIDGAGSTARKIATTALKWLLCAQTSLATNDFLKAVTFDAGGKREPLSVATLLDVCGNLVVFDKKLDVFRFTHSSVREFLEMKPGFSSCLTHATVAEICLDTLLSQEWLTSEMVWQRSTLSQYAALYWATHIENCGLDSHQRKIRESLLRFCVRDDRSTASFAKWLKSIKSISSILSWDEPLKNKIEQVLNFPPETSLFTACAFGFPEVVKLLVEKRPSLTRRVNSKGATGLHLACQYGHFDVVNFLLQNKAEIDAKDEDGETPLVRAAAMGYDAVIKLLLSHGANRNISGRKYGSALQAAALRGHEEVVTLLLDKSGIQAESGQFGTALQAASIRGHDNIVKILLAKGANVNAPGGEYLTTPTESAKLPADTVDKIIEFLLKKQQLLTVHNCPLDHSPRYRHESKIQLLLDNSIDFNIQTAGFGPALHAASRGGHDHVVGTLLSSGAKVNDEGGTYGTALQAAAVSGNQEIVRLLLEYGADVNTQKGLYHTALQASCRFKRHRIIELLLDLGADVNSLGGTYGSALQAAARSGDEQIIHLLLKNGADVNVQGGEYNTALQAASENGNDKIVQTLLDHGAFIDTQGGKFGTALQAACEAGCLTVVQLLVGRGAKFGSALQIASVSGHLPIVAFLLNKGADPNSYGGSFGTALEMATYSGKQSIVQLLLANGADANSKGSYFGTALEVAASAGNEELTNLLLSKGANLGIKEKRKFPRAMFRSDASEHDAFRKGRPKHAIEAAAGNGHLEILQTLLQFSSQLYQGTELDNLIIESLTLASRNGHLDSVKMLLDHRKLSHDGTEYRTAVRMASKNGHVDIACFLIERGAEVDGSGSRYDRTPLQTATAGQNEAAVRFLLERGAQVNIERYDVGTALDVASDRGYQNLVKILLDAGANPNISDLIGLTALTLASYGGYHEIVRMLLDKGADVNAKVKYNLCYSAGQQCDNPLQAAAHEGHEKVVQLLVDRKAAVDEATGCHGTALLAACLKGHSRIVKLLLLHGADVNKRGGIYETALQAAIHGGFETIVSSLLDHGADINIEGGYFGTALQAAAAGGHEDIVRLLIGKGADVKSQGGEPKGDLSHGFGRRPGFPQKEEIEDPKGRRQNGRFGTALQAAAFVGNKEIVQILLENGADIGDTDVHGQTPLHRAAHQGHEAIVVYLLEKGANINKADKKGRTALRLVADYGYQKLLGLLSQNGAAINSPDTARQTPLHRAAMNGHMGVVEKLIEKGANIEAADWSRQTPLMSAAVTGNASIVRLLANRGAQIDKYDKKRQTALHLAAMKGHRTSLRALLELGADAEAQSRDGTTALHLAAVNGNLEVCHLLLRYGAKVDAKDGNGQTALHLAARQGDGIVVEMLRLNGASIEARDNYERTPLHQAAAFGQCRIIQLLLDAGANIESQDRDKSTPLTLTAVRIAGQSDDVWAPQISAAYVLVKNGADIRKLPEGNEHDPSSVNIKNAVLGLTEELGDAYRLD